MPKHFVYQKYAVYEYEYYTNRNHDEGTVSFSKVS